MKLKQFLEQYRCFENVVFAENEENLIDTMLTVQTKEEILSWKWVVWQAGREHSFQQNLQKPDTHEKSAHNLLRKTENIDQRFVD